MQSHVAILTLGLVAGGITCVAGVIGLIANMRSWTDSRIITQLRGGGAVMSWWRVVFGLCLILLPYMTLMHHSQLVLLALAVLIGSFGVASIGLSILGIRNTRYKNRQGQDANHGFDAPPTSPSPRGDH
jgi:hypothetical protein